MHSLLDVLTCLMSTSSCEDGCWLLLRVCWRKMGLGEILEVEAAAQESLSPKLITVLEKSVAKTLGEG